MANRFQFPNKSRIIKTGEMHTSCWNSSYGGYCWGLCILIEASSWTYCVLKKIIVAFLSIVECIIQHCMIRYTELKYWISGFESKLLFCEKSLKGWNHFYSVGPSWTSTGWFPYKVGFHQEKSCHMTRGMTFIVWSLIRKKNKKQCIYVCKISF